MSTEIMGGVLKVFTGRAEGRQRFANFRILLRRYRRWRGLGCGGW